jgi:hypothetical protein
MTGNLARMLLVTYSLTGDPKYLKAATGWCDHFVGRQKHTKSYQGNRAGYWHTHNERTNIYLGDTGTAATALATACRYVDPERKKEYLNALVRFANFVIEGCIDDPDGLGRGNSPGWILQYGFDRGALGCGYYKGHVSRLPYTTATGTTGGGFFSALYALTGDPHYKEIAISAVQWLLNLVQSSGEIPYILDNQQKDYWPYTTMTYAMEGILGAYWRIKDAQIKALIVEKAYPCVRWLLKTQNDDGTWAEFNSPDQKRSPEVLSLLVWYFNEVKNDPGVLKAIRKNCQYILDKAKAEKFGIKKSFPTSSFIGLAIAETLKPGITFLVN